MAHTTEIDVLTYASTAIITKGYSRDHRPDLKQCLLDLIVSSDGGIPFFMRTGDRNKSDKPVFVQILSDVKKTNKIR